MPKVMLNRMTWREAEEAARARRPVLIPIGTQENQGQHNILGADTFIAETVAARAAERSGAVVAPTLPYGGSKIFAAYPGTITLRPEVQVNVYEDILTSLARPGFDHLLFINYHQNNDWMVEEACRRLRVATGIIAGQIQIGNVGRDISLDLYDGKPRAVSHGADPATSLMLHLYPNDVRMDVATDDRIRDFQGFELQSPTALKFRGSRVNLYLDLEEVSPNGGLGNPGYSSAELGQTVLERLIDYVAGFVEQFKGIDTRPNRQ